MKRLSIFAISVISALALTAAIGSAAASANTVLCSVNESVCPAGDVLPAGSYQTFGGDMTLTSTTDSTRFDCGPVGFAAKTTAESGAPLPATGEYALYTTHCEVVGQPSSCTSISMANTQDSLYKSLNGWIIGSSSAPLTVTLHCYGVTCQYSTEGAFMSVPRGGMFPGEEAKIEGAGMTRTVGGLLCPGGTSFKLNYNGSLQNDSYLASSS